MWRPPLLQALLLFSCLSLGFSLSAQAQPTVPAADSLALVALYNATNGPGWTNNSNWLTGSVDTWHGITVSNGRVSDVQLQQNQLQGTLPAALGDLEALQRFYLSSNQLEGTIPTSFGNLASLEDIRLSTNDLTGNIPTTLGSLGNLRILDLSKNELTGAVPSSFGSLGNLELLYVYDNQLEGSLPASLVNLSQLKLLHAQINQLTDVPDLSGLSALDFVALFNNALTFEDIEPLMGVGLFDYNYAPQALVGAPTSESIDEGENLTLQIPVGGANNQYQWFKNGSPIAGATADTYGLTSATMADAGDYTLEITNTVATDLTLESHPITVTVIDVVTPLEQDSLALVTFYNATDGPNWTDNTNWLTGPVHTWHGVRVAAGRVEYLQLNNNNLEGALPSEIGALTGLWVLDLSANNLQGGIPAELGNLNRLAYLDLGVNNLSGTIPNEVGDLHFLVRLNLRRNDLRGSLPPLQNLTQLQIIDMSNNQLEGSLPDWLGDLPELHHIRLSGNRLSGSIPENLGNSPNLQDLSVGGNQLSGSIPSSLGNVHTLTHISAGNNQLSGSLPSEIGNLTSLISIQLDRNQLEGSIPASWGNLSELTVLYLFDNNMSGVLPPEIGGMTALRFLVLDNNQFRGSVPEEIGNLVNLGDLRLKNNQFTGPLPATFSNLTQLRALYIDDNAFEGTLPIGALTNLGDIRFANNQIEGLPDLGAAIDLYTIIARNNRLTFEDIEPNIGLARNGIFYTPQARVGTPTNESVQEGDSLTLQMPVGGANNQYQWFKDGSPISGATTDTYVITDATPADAGSYTLKITNTVAIQLILESHPFAVAFNVGPEVAITNGPTGTRAAGEVTFVWSGSDPDGAIAGYEWILEGPEPGNGSTTATTVTFDVQAEGGYIFWVRAEDDSGAFSPWVEQAFAIDIASAPQTQADAVTTSEDTALPAIDVLGNDTDPDGTALAVTNVSEPQFGTASINADGMISYIPDADFHGTDTFVYTVADADGMTGQGTVTITVTPVNDAPYFTSTPDKTTAEGQVYAYAITATDVDGDALTLDGATLPSWLALTDSNHASALLTGTPMQADVGTHDLVLTVTDGTEMVEQAFELAVTDTNTPPSAPTLTALTGGSTLVLEGDPDAAFVVTWTASDDPDGDPLTYRWELATEDRFMPLLFSEEVGEATRFETTISAIGDLLKAQGVAINTSITLFHRIVTSDGVDETVSDPAQITLTRGIITDTETSAAVPEEFVLRGNYPNPFNPETTIQLDVPEAAQVTVVIYDVLGREAKRVEAGALAAGRGQAIQIAASDLSSGVYVYRVIGRLASGEVKIATGRMTLLK